MEFETVGTYALVLDNTFSKKTAKTVQFTQRIIPTSSELGKSRVDLDINHSSAKVNDSLNPNYNISSLSIAASSSPLVDAITVENGNLEYQAASNPEKILKSTSFQHSSVNITTKSIERNDRNASSCISNDRYLRGTMLKKKRKKLQGYARRYFSLDYKYGILNYYLSPKSSVLRGSMPIRLCAITALPKTLTIFVDSGMEVWNLKAISKTDFETWTSALDVVRHSKIHQSSPINDDKVLNIQPSLSLIDNDNNIQHSINLVNVYKSSQPIYFHESSNLIENLDSLFLKLNETAIKTKESLNYLIPNASLENLKTKESLNLHENKTLASINPQRKPSLWKRLASQQQCSHDNTTTPLPSTLQKPLNFTDSPSSNIIDDSGSATKNQLQSSKSQLKQFNTLKDVSVTLESLAQELKSIIDSERNRISKDNNDLPKLIRPLSVNSTMSMDEYFDAEEYNQNANGVVYIDKCDDSLGSSSESEAYDNELIVDDVIEEDEDDINDSSDEEGDLTMQTHLTSGIKEYDEVDDIDGKKYLYPLNEVKTIDRRKTIPLAAASPPSLISLVRKSVGKDLSTIAMPVSANEPVTILQRMCELFEYTNLINEGLKFNVDSPERILYIAIFATSYLSSGRAKERATRKPFNPLLGETFELVSPERGIRVITEKVSHRPPIMAIQAESTEWILQYSPNPHQQFWGKSAEINNKGYVKLTHISSGEVYEWEQPTTFLRNVIAGEKYVEPVGTLIVVSSCGYKVVVEFKSGSMFSGRSEELKAKLFDSKGKEINGYGFSGKWTESIDLFCGNQETKNVWEVGNLVKDYKKRFGFTEFAASLNEITSIEDNIMAPTDSRLRPDQRYYENGDVDKAEIIKLDLEEKQRQRRKQLEENGSSYSPAFFELDPADNIYKLKSGQDNYWKRRRNGNWEGLIDLFH